MLTLFRGLIAGTLLLSSVTAAPLEAQNAGEPLIPPVGLDMSATDPSTRPGDDFWQYANGSRSIVGLLPIHRSFQVLPEEMPPAPRL